MLVRPASDVLAKMRRRIAPCRRGCARAADRDPSRACRIPPPPGAAGNPVRREHGRHIVAVAGNRAHCSACYPRAGARVSPWSWDRTSAVRLDDEGSTRSSNLSRSCSITTPRHVTAVARRMGPLRRYGPRCAVHAPGGPGSPPLLGAAEYDKPATGLYLLREHILADTARFDAAFRQYIRRWAYKHPTPATSSAPWRTGSGGPFVVLAWLFYRSDRRRPAVDSVRARTDSTGASALVFLSSLGASRCPSTCDLPTPTAPRRTCVCPSRSGTWGTANTYRRSVPADVVKGRDRCPAEFPGCAAGE